MTAADSHTLLPMVSVIISAYNAGKYIADTINSFLGQTYSRWEMIIINDGSHDDTAAIMDSFARSDHRITCISQENKGMTAARKTGVDKACGKYVLIFDSDDIIYPEALDTLVHIAETNSADIVSIPFRFWYPDGHKEESIRPDYNEIDGVTYLKKALEEKAYWALWQIMIRRDVISKADFDTGKDLLLGEDMVITIQIMSLRPKIVSCPVPLIDYRIRNDSISRIRTEKFHRDFRRSLDLSTAILKQDRNLYRKLRKSIAAAQIDRRLSGIFMGNPAHVGQDLKESLLYLFRYPALWSYLKRKDKTMFRLMRTYLFVPQKAIDKATRIATDNRH